MWGHRPASALPRGPPPHSERAFGPRTRNRGRGARPPDHFLGGRCAGIGRPFLARRPCRSVPAPSAPARAPRASGTDRLDQRARPRLRLPPAHHPTRRGVRRRELLRPVCAGASAAPGRRMSAPTSHACAAAAWSSSRELERAAGPAGPIHGGRHSTLAREPLPRHVRAGSRGARDHRRRGCERPRDRLGERGRCRRRAEGLGSGAVRTGARGSGRRKPEAAATGRAGRPHQHRQLSQRRRLRGSSACARAWTDRA